MGCLEWRVESAICKSWNQSFGGAVGLFADEGGRELDIGRPSGLWYVSSGEDMRITDDGA